MYAMLRDKSGKSLEVEILEAGNKVVYQSASADEEAMRIHRYEIQSPLPVETPGAYLFEMSDGEIVEAKVVFCQALPTGHYYMLAVVSEKVPSLVA